MCMLRHFQPYPLSVTDHDGGHAPHVRLMKALSVFMPAICWSLGRRREMLLLNSIFHLQGSAWNSQAHQAEHGAGLVTAQRGHA